MQRFIGDIFQEYYDIGSLINDIERFIKISDDNSIKKLLYQNHFKDEVKRPGIDVLDGVFFKHTKENLDLSGNEFFSVSFYVGFIYLIIMVQKKLGLEKTISNLLLLKLVINII